MKKRILLVDDTPEVLMAVAAILNAVSDHEIVPCGKVGEAVILLQTSNFDLVISDLQMPDGGGELVSRTARRLGMPVIIITGVLEQMDDEAKRVCGANAYIGKPFDYKKLLATANDLLAVMPTIKTPEPVVAHV